MRIAPIGAGLQAVQLRHRERRLAQMLDELRAGDVYMKMPWAKKR